MIAGCAIRSSPFDIRHSAVPPRDTQEKTFFCETNPFAVLTVQVAAQTYCVAVADAYPMCGLLSRPIGESRMAETDMWPSPGAPGVGESNAVTRGLPCGTGLQPVFSPVENRCHRSYWDRR